MATYLVTVSGEIPLRSRRTRPRFYGALFGAIADAVQRAGGKVTREELLEAKVLVEAEGDVLEAISRVFGVKRVAEVAWREFSSLDELAAWAASVAGEDVRGKKFAVRAKRSGRHAFTSMDVERAVGAALLPLSAGVDLERPEAVVEIEVRGNRAFVYRRAAEGPGGLPAGVEGRALALFSGGFDSPVAAWMVARRGARVDLLHLYMGSSSSTYHAYLVARELARRWLHGYRPAFVAVDFVPLIAEVSERVDWRYRQVVLRALMYVVASRIAEAEGYDAIVTGESIGQASSQTLSNLSSIEKALGLGIPVLRPLAGMDKEDIVRLSARIGTYELSAKVVEACAIAPRRVATATRPEEVREQLAKVRQSLIDEAVAGARRFDLLSTPPESAVMPSDVEIDFVPEGALLVDLRGRASRERLPIPGSVNIGEVDLGALPRDKVIVLFCETGALSAIMALELRQRGLRAYSFRGGAGALASAIRASACSGQRQ
ncbi:MAG: THUMP domain-containing protein [Desulfurococcaceae archaeon]